MIPTYAEQRKSTAHLRDFMKNHVWKDCMPRIHDALSNGTSFPFVVMCLQLGVGRTTCHSIKKFERDIKNVNSRWPTILQSNWSTYGDPCTKGQHRTFATPWNWSCIALFKKGVSYGMEVCKKEGRSHYSKGPLKLLQLRGPHVKIRRHVFG